MIVWLNGAFGVGKTSTGQVLCADESRRLFDPEIVGYVVAAQLKELEFDDFQDLALWRSLVPLVAEQIHNFTGTDLVAVQSVLNEDYWNEIKAGVAATGMRLVHVLLDCEEGELRRRIESDQQEAQARQWRLDHLEVFQRAKPWMIGAADLVIDNTSSTVAQIAADISDHISEASQGSYT